MNLSIIRMYPLLRQRLLLSNSVLKILEKNALISAYKTQWCYFSNSCHRLQKEKPRGQLTKSESESDVSTTVYTGKEVAKTFSYGIVILFGLGVTGVLFYIIFIELFSEKSPNKVYSKALDKCIKDSKVLDSLGEPIKGFGEENRRGRRRHVSHLIYEKNGRNHMRMKFYIKGSRRKATVHLEVAENAKKNFEYRYLFVQLDDYPHTSIVLEDNRSNDITTPDMALPPLLPITDGSFSA